MTSTTTDKRIRHGLTVRHAPSPWKRHWALLKNFREAIEDAVIGKRGAISIVDAELINTIMEQHRMNLGATQYLKDNLGENGKVTEGALSPADVARFMKMASDAALSRSINMQKLGLDAKEPGEGGDVVWEQVQDHKNDEP